MLLRLLGRFAEALRSSCIAIHVMYKGTKAAYVEAKDHSAVSRVFDAMVKVNSYKPHTVVI